VDRTNQSSGQAARRLGTPSNVQPDRLSGPAHGVFVWGTVLVAWLVSLLPWRLWQGAPDILLLIIAFWCVHEPRRVGLFTAFFFGLLMDVHDAGLLGEHARCHTRWSRMAPWRCTAGCSGSTSGARPCTCCLCSSLPAS